MKDPELLHVLYPMFCIRQAGRRIGLSGLREKDAEGDAERNEGGGCSQYDASGLVANVNRDYACRAAPIH